MVSKRNKLFHTKGGKAPVVSSDDYWKHIVPLDHATLQPPSLCETVRGSVVTTENATALAAERNPPKPRRKRIAEEQTEIRQSVALLIKRELSSEAQPPAIRPAVQQRVGKYGQGSEYGKSLKSYGTS